MALSITTVDKTFSIQQQTIFHTKETISSMYGSIKTFLLKRENCPPKVTDYNFLRLLDVHIRLKIYNHKMKEDLLFIVHVSCMSEEVVPPNPLLSYQKLCQDVLFSLTEYWDNVARYLYPWYPGDQEVGVGEPEGLEPGTTIETIDMTRPLVPANQPSKIVDLNDLDIDDNEPIK